MSCFLIKNGITVSDRETRKQDILCENGRIVSVAENIDAPCVECKVYDAEGLFVLPGLIDAHTHYHLVSRGTVTADSFAEGSRLACFGGVTTVVDFADDNRGMSLSESFSSRLEDMKKEMAIDFSLHQGVYGHSFDNSYVKQLESIKKHGCRTVKIFTTYRETGYLIENREDLKQLFSAAAGLGLLVTVHCEYNPMIEQISSTWKGTFLPKDHADLRPAQAEEKAIEDYGTLAMEAGCPLYIVHLSSEAGLNAVRKLRSKGATIYVETTPTYLFLDRSKLEGSDASLYVMTPPLRTKRDNIALQEALADGEIDVVATDHCAFTRQQKLASNDTRTIYPGIPGTEEMFHLLYSHAEKTGKISLNDIVRLTSTNPAKLFGMYPQKGSFEVGSDADFAIVEPNFMWTLTDSNIHSASGYTPYRGFDVRCRVKATVLGAGIIMENGEYFGKPGKGRYINQHD